MADEYIKMPEVKKLTALSKASIYRAVAAGTFPAPYSIGARAVAWKRSAVEDWIAKRPVARGAGVRNAAHLAHAAA